MAVRKLFGKVVKISANKTISVEVEKIFSHNLYKKILRKKSRYLTHDPNNIAKVGDNVFIVESRPISKMKRWCLLEVN